MAAVSSFELANSAAFESVILVLVAWRGIPIVVRTVEHGRSFALLDPFDDALEALAERLRVGEEAACVRGDVALHLARIGLDRRFSRRRPSAGALSMLGLAVLLLSAVALIAAPSPLEAREPPLAHPARLLVAQPGLKGVAEPEPERPALHASPDPTSDFVDSEGSMRCGDAEMGRPDRAERGRYGVAGPLDNPDPHLARSQGDARASRAHFDVRGSAPGADANAPATPWGRDEALGNDLASQRGALWADRLADAHGAHGLGRAREDSGVAKRIVSSPLDRPSPERRVLHAGLRAQGALRPSSVARAMAARFHLFEGCFRARTGELPPRAARVDLELEVLASGALATLSIPSSDIRDEPLLECLRAAVQSVSFPASDEGSTWVLYPLLLTTG